MKEMTHDEGLKLFLGMIRTSPKYPTALMLANRISELKEETAKLEQQLEELKHHGHVAAIDHFMESLIKRKA